MRSCSNCVDCHSKIIQDEEILMCENNPFEIKEVKATDVCDSHRYVENCSLEKNELFYDDTLFGPGFLIINTRNGEIIKFLKVFIINPNGVPAFGFKFFSKEATKSDDDRFIISSFTFRDVEDEDNNLYKIFDDFCDSLNNKTVYTHDILNKDESHFNLYSDGNVISLNFFKDRLNSSDELTDINLGNYFTSRCYREVFALFMSLIKYKKQTLTSEEAKQITRERI